MNYLKPQAPIMNGEDYIYPVTTADQVVVGAGTEGERRLEMNGQVVADDSYKLGGLAPEYYTWTDNLLFNSNFQKPYLINMTGFTEFLAPSGAPDNVNGWYGNRATVQISDAGLMLTRNTTESTSSTYIGQKMTDVSRLAGLPFTLAFMTGKGLIIGSFTFQDVSTEIASAYGWTISYSKTNSAFVILTATEESIMIKWAVLVPGTYTAETLPQPHWLHPRLEMIRMGLPMNPRNLLDNSDFRNPVNQRGQTSYTGTGYGIDRWRTNYSGDTVKIASGGVKNEVNSSSDGWHLHQIIKVGEELVGKSVTVAAKVVAASTTDCRIVCSFRNSSDSEISFIGVKCVNGVISASGVIPVGTVQIRVGLFAYDMTSGDYVTLEWAALYEGAYTLETLPPYVPKENELAACMRYLYPLGGGGAAQWFPATIDTRAGYCLSVVSTGIVPASTNYSLTSANWEMYIDGSWINVGAPNQVRVRENFLILQWSSPSPSTWAGAVANGNVFWKTDVSTFIEFTI